MSIERVERKDGTIVWRVRWRQGESNRSKVLGRKRDAEAFDAELRRRRRTGELEQLDAGKETLAEFGEEWWKLYGEPNLAPSTLQVYATVWDAHVMPRIGSLSLRELTPSVLNRFRLELEADGVGRVSITKTLTLLQGVLQRACEWDRIATNPVRAVRKPPTGRTRAVTADDPGRGGGQSGRDRREAADGHRMLVHGQAIPRSDRFKARTIYDFGHVLHDLQVNAWVLAWRRLVGETLLDWHGETEIHPPTGLRRDAKDPFLRVDRHSDRSAENLRDERPRLLRPDAIIEVAADNEGPPLTYLIEFDRTRRVDKNYDKFRRYDCFLNYWRRHTDFDGDDEDAPWVIFICQDRDHALQFLNAADRELTGNVYTPRVTDGEDWVGRRRIAFCVEPRMYEGSPRAWLLPERPPRESDANTTRQLERIWLPGERAEMDSVAA
jgi:hypothetical protein